MGSIADSQDSVTPKAGINQADKPVVRKFNMKFRLDTPRSDNEFIIENLIYLDLKEITLEQVVKLINASLDMPHKIKNPKGFEVFEKPDKIAKKEIK
jgi:hypothetical protein